MQAMMRETSYAQPQQRTAAEGNASKMSVPKIQQPGEDTRSAGGHASEEDTKAVQERAASSPPASRAQTGERLVVAPGSTLETGSRSPNITRASATSRLAQLRLSNLAKKRGAAWSSKMAEVPEHEPEPEPRPAPGSPELPPPEGGSPPSPGMSVLAPPSPSVADEVTPSLPDEFLIKLGLDPANKELSADQMSETELEGKFSSLALAFKTDKLTLQQRLQIQERARNIAEQNVDAELQCLRSCIEEMKALCTDAQQRTHIGKLEHHVEVLEQAAARVSSRAEVLGAVQQEHRMSNAMEVMVVYVENLKRMHDREHAELEEAKKHIQDRTSLLPDLGDHSKRSMSVCAINASAKARRRSEVALPRIMGGTGSPSLVNMQSLDARQRFQSAVANTSVRNVVTSTLRRASLERQSSVNSTPTFSRDNSGDRGRDDKKPPNSKQNSQEEEAFQKGFEAGLKTKLGEELMELREQQNTMSAKIENTMDKVEESREEEEKREAQIAAAKEAILVRISQFRPNWATATRNLRWVACGLLCLVALVIAVVNVLLPVTLDVTRNTASSH